MTIDAVLANSPNHWAAWLLIVVFFLIWGTPKLLSEETANKNFWVISRLARLSQDWIQNRKKRSLEREVEYGQSLADVLSEEVRALRQANSDQFAYFEEKRKQDKAIHKRDLDALRKTIEEEQQQRQRIESRLECELKQATGYIAWVSGWAREALIAAKEGGWETKMPTWMSYADWKHKHDGA